MKPQKGATFEELAKAKIRDSRSLVISSCSKGGFTMAQQIEVQEGQRITSVFMSGAIQIEDVNGLYNLRDALNVCIERVESAKSEKVAHGHDWD